MMPVEVRRVLVPKQQNLLIPERLYRQRVNMEGG